MNSSSRIAIVLSTTSLAFGIGLAPTANAAQAVGTAPVSAKHASAGHHHHKQSDKTGAKKAAASPAAKAK